MGVSLLEQRLTQLLVCAGRRGLESSDGLKMFNGGIRLPHHQFLFRLIELGICKLRPGLCRVVLFAKPELLGGLLGLPQASQGQAHLVVGIAPLWIQLDGFAEVYERFLEVFLINQHLAQRILCVHGLGGHRHYFAQLGDLLLDVSLAAVGDSKIVVGAREGGIKFHRAFQLLDRLSEVALRQHGAKIGMRFGGIGFLLNCLAKFLDGLLALIGLYVHESQRQMGFIEIRCFPDGRPELLRHRLFARALEAQQVA